MAESVTQALSLAQLQDDQAQVPGYPVNWPLGNERRGILVRLEAAVYSRCRVPSSSSLCLRE